jgi:hypothetical protein
VIKWEREIINETEKERENEHDMDYAYLTTVGVHRLDMQERLCFNKLCEVVFIKCNCERERER